MKNNLLIGKTVYYATLNGFYRIAYIENEEKLIIEYPGGWKISDEYNKLKYGNMLSLKKRYWFVSLYEVKFVNKTINNE